MNAEYFLDTNIVVYAFDQSAPEKRRRSISLIEDEAPWFISRQIVQEFANVALHRFRILLTPSFFLADFTDRLLWPHCGIHPAASIYSEALRIHQQTRYRYYNSLIGAAALESGAPILYSKDLQHGRQIGPLRIVNPFL